jgi:DNA polymerase I-like protein with 3'-5' exonuclease and polymerase domains
LRQLPAFLQDLDPTIYLRDNYVVLDFEIDTSHGDYGNPVHPANQMLLGSWKTGPGHPHGVTRHDLWATEYELGPLLDAIQQADFLVAHNAKYELGWLRRAGLDLHRVLVFDTKIGEYVLLGNLAAGDEVMPPRSTSLDVCGQRRGFPAKDPVVDIMLSHGINPVRIPRPWLSTRCAQDVETTETIFLDQRDLLARTGRLPIMYTRCLLTPVLADIENEGMALDAARVGEEYEKASKTLAELETKMTALTGGINWRSGKQVAEYLYDKLKFDELRKPSGEPKRTKPSKLHPNGQRLTDQKTLVQLKASTKEQKSFLELRGKIGKVNALLSKNLEFFQGVVNEYGGVFYAEFNQTVTATHRLSSSGIELLFQSIKDKKGKPSRKRVQLQNTPRRLKRVFRAKRPGWLMADPDGSQLEFRVAVALALAHDLLLVKQGKLDKSQIDWQGLRDVEDPNWDAHVTSAAAMEGVAYDVLYAKYKAGDEDAAEARQLAKPETFKPLYGGRKGTKKQERWYVEFRRRYPGIARVQDAWIEEVVQTKRLILPYGMRFYWPYARRQGRDGYVNVTTAVSNYPVQSLATAEIIPIAMVYLWHRVHQEGLDAVIRMVSTVHDSAPTEVHPDHLDDFRRIVKQSFTHDVYAYLEKVYGLDFGVPLGVGLKVGEFLGEGKEESYNVWKDGREVRVK